MPEIVAFLKGNTERAGCQVMGLEALVPLLGTKGALEAFFMLDGD